MERAGVQSWPAQACEEAVEMSTGRSGKGPPGLPDFGPRSPNRTVCSLALSLGSCWAPLVLALASEVASVQVPWGGAGLASRGPWKRSPYASAPSWLGLDPCAAQKTTEEPAEGAGFVLCHWASCGSCPIC